MQAPCRPHADHADPMQTQCRPCRPFRLHTGLSCLVVQGLRTTQRRTTCISLIVRSACSLHASRLLHVPPACASRSVVMSDIYGTHHVMMCLGAGTAPGLGRRPGHIGLGHYETMQHKSRERNSAAASEWQQLDIRHTRGCLKAVARCAGLGQLELC